MSTLKSYQILNNMTHHLVSACINTCPRYQSHHFGFNNLLCALFFGKMTNYVAITSAVRDVRAPKNTENAQFSIKNKGLLLVEENRQVFCGFELFNCTKRGFHFSFRNRKIVGSIDYF